MNYLSCVEGFVSIFFEKTSMDSMDVGGLIQYSLLLPRSTHLSACLFWGLARDDSFGVGAPIFVGGNSFATGVPGHVNAS